ncbi:MAG: BamA/TamA family outer membrane protein, partial [Longimicrobiales bacterium]|nr:BamA/TamA family outer membrane protein [Longimicrobiales bacterium]
FAGFGFAVFTDAGNVFATRSGVTLSDLEHGAGAGLRWRSPIGLVRADIAWPVSRPDPEPRLHFVVGGVL